MKRIDKVKKSEYEEQYAMVQKLAYWGARTYIVAKFEEQAEAYRTTHRIEKYDIYKANKAKLIPNGTHKDEDEFEYKLENRIDDAIESIYNRPTANDTPVTLEDKVDDAIEKIKEEEKKNNPHFHPDLENRWSEKGGPFEDRETFIYYLMLAVLLDAHYNGSTEYKMRGTELKKKLPFWMKKLTRKLAQAGRMHTFVEAMVPEEHAASSSQKHPLSDSSPYDSSSSASEAGLSYRHAKHRGSNNV